VAKYIICYIGAAHLMTMAILLTAKR